MQPYWYTSPPCHMALYVYRPKHFLPHKEALISENDFHKPNPLLHGHLPGDV